MRSIDLIVIHCSDSPNGDSLFRASPGGPGKITPVEIIDGWHRERKFRRDQKWRRIQNPALTSIGYHFVIYLNSAVATGRHLDEIGAHARGHNATSIGICLVGTDKFTEAQFGVLRHLVSEMRERYPGARICGHRDLSPDTNGDGVVEPRERLKTCPGFDVAAWLARGMQPLPENIQEP